MVENIATDETPQLIASDKVQGTAVYGADGAKLGSVYNFMVDKFSGRVGYAVLQFGGILGIGSDYYPLPWETLQYDTEKGGYRVDIDPQTLENAPHYDDGDDPVYDLNFGRQVYTHYGIAYPY